MPPIHLQLLLGPTAGRHVTFEQERVTFGRADDCDLVLAEALVSRHHGELRFEDGHWAVCCLSPQGLRVNRRRVSAGSHVLADGDVISVGGHRALRVGLEAPSEVDERADGARRLSGRAKLWIGIGIYLLVAAAVIGVLAGLMGRRAAAPVLTAEILGPERIRQIVTRRPPARAHPDAARSAEALRLAREFYAQRKRARANLFHAFRSYQEALSWSGTEGFEDRGDILDFAAAEKTLVDEVTAHYQNGCALLQSGQFIEADRTFRDLITRFPDPESTLFQNVERHRRAALGQVSGRRRR